jgi:hypothetical protein
MEGVQICTPTTNNIKGPNRPTNHDVWTFWQVSSQKGLNSTKIICWTCLSGQLSFMKWTSLLMLHNT